MYTKLFAFAAFVTVARAGNLLAPAFTYSAAPLSIGAQHQSVVRSLDGDSSVSHYSKAVDSAFSSVRKYDTRITNDAKFFAPAAITYAAAAPIVKAAPAFAYAAPAPIAVKAAPAYGYHTYAPSAAYVAHTAFTGLGAHYAF